MSWTLANDALDQVRRETVLLTDSGRFHGSVGKPLTLDHHKE